jgi:hypothetical protein
MYKIKPVLLMNEKRNIFIQLQIVYVLKVQNVILIVKIFNLSIC